MPGRVLTEILALAAEQNGYVRTREVRELGIDPRRLNDYAQRGLAEHVGRGLYRIELMPHGDLDEFARATQWPDGRGTLSGETALDLHELCDVSPAHIDITVPRGYRTHGQAPALSRLHRCDLADEEVTWLQGVPIVTPHARRRHRGRAATHAHRPGHRHRRALSTHDGQAGSQTAPRRMLGRDMSERR